MKSVVIIDTPAHCEDCPCSYFTEGACEDYCKITKTVIEDRLDILEDCPLKALPKSRLCNYYDFEHYTSGYDKGWNDCIEQITGENKRANNKGKDKTET